MKSALDDLLERIRARRQALLDGYDEENLHQLRVDMRRLRGLLRFANAPEARRLRKAWGHLISHTNEARDWDTLAVRFEAMPRDGRSDRLADALAVRRADIAAHATTSLTGADWEACLDQTRAYLASDASAHQALPGAEETIDEATRRANRAWSKARKHGRSDAWHKLRIAVKDLRYSLDTLAAGDVEKRIDLCKALQEHLGIWHDSIVHRELLGSVHDGAPDVATATSIRRLQRTLAREGKRRLHMARELLEAEGDPPF